MKSPGESRIFWLVASVAVIVVSAGVILLAALHYARELLALFVGLSILGVAALYLSGHPVWAIVVAVIVGVPAIISQFNWDKGQVLFRK